MSLSKFVVTNTFDKLTHSNAQIRQPANAVLFSLVASYFIVSTVLEVRSQMHTQHFFFCLSVVHGFFVSIVSGKEDFPSPHAFNAIWLERVRVCDIQCIVGILCASENRRQFLSSCTGERQQEVQLNICSQNFRETSQKNQSNSFPPSNRSTPPTSRMSVEICDLFFSLTTTISLVVVHLFVLVCFGVTSFLFVLVAKMCDIVWFCNR